jgi:hypothetical protein
MGTRVEHEVSLAAISNRTQSSQMVETATISCLNHRSIKVSLLLCLWQVSVKGSVTQTWVDRIAPQHSSVCPLNSPYPDTVTDHVSMHRARTKQMGKTVAPAWLGRG